MPLPSVHLITELEKRVDVSESELVKEETWRLRFVDSRSLRCLILLRNVDGAYELTVLQCYGLIHYDVYLDDVLAVETVGGFEQNKKGMTFRIPPLPPTPPPHPTNGTLIADGTEQKLIEGSSPSFKLSAYIDLSHMQVGDEVVIREYMMIKEGGEYRKYHEETYIGVQEPPILYITPKTVTYGGKITLQQNMGSFKSFDYSIIKE